MPFPILKNEIFFVGTATIDPVLGFRASRASLFFVPNEPNPLNSTLLEFIKDVIIVSKKVSTDFSVLTFTYYYVLIDFFV